MWISSGVAAILLAGLGALGVTLWLLRRGPRKGIKTRYPIVLVPGMLGFDEIGLGSVKRKYFHEIPEHLTALGVKVYRISLPSISSVSKRAEALIQDLDSIPEKKVNLIAHSRGGLDARYAISKLDHTKKIASLVTIAAPHRGTPIADVGSTIFGKIGLRINSFADLTTSAADTFNQSVTDSDSVHYASVVATIDKDSQQPTWLIPLIKLLYKKSGPNDGMVPVNSQRWGQVIAEIQAHHWAQIGWSTGFDAKRMYRQILSHLRKKGL